MNNNIPEENNSILSPEQLEVINDVPIPEEVTIKIEEPKSISKDVQDMNNAFKLSELIYKDVLSPQLSENEQLKREHKTLLMNNIFKILKWQFIFTYVFVALLLGSILLSGVLSISENMLIEIIGFVKYYIGAIVIELLSILLFIVKSVFDKSIVDLIKDFDKRK